MTSSQQAPATKAVIEIVTVTRYTVEKVTLDYVSEPHRCTDPQHGDGTYWKISAGPRDHAFVQTNEELRTFAPALADHLAGQLAG